MDGELYKQVCCLENLLSAWTKVKGKGSAGGIDRVTIETFDADLEKNLKELSEQLTSYRYIPEPYQEIKIPKDDNEFRSLSLPTIKDKIVQQAVKDLIEPILDREFLDVSYAYRANKGPAKAIGRVTHLIANEKREWVTLCDIDSYFDTINHNLLFPMIVERIKDQKACTLIRLWVRMGKVDPKMKWKDTKIGIPQGGIISPLLSNLYLHTFDRFMVEKRFGLVRYADDFIILSHTEGEAYRALKETRSFLEKELKLRLNTGSLVKRVDEGFEFLGITFKGQEKTISAEKLADLKSRIAKAIDIKKDKNIESLVDTIEGMDRYYGRILTQNVLEELDRWTEGCLKGNIREAYQEGVFENKAEIEKKLLLLNFMSHKYGLFKNRAIKNIVAYCRKTRKKDSSRQLAGSKRDPIKKKKREYQRLESEGFEMIITTPGVFIGKTKKGISIKERGIKKHEAPLLNLKNISVLSWGVTISSNVIHYCAERQIPIYFMSFDGKPYAKLYPFQSFSATLGIAQLKAFENGKANTLAKTFVSAKIKNQINLAKYWNKYREKRDEDFSAIFNDRIILMESLANSARKVHEQDIEVLRGKLFSIEGRAASYYWELVEKMLDDYIEFEGRIRKGATDLVNCLLNYGYGILYSRIWDAINRAGLNPCISYLHVPQEGKPSLVFDFIEEFRQQAVDKAVFPLITKGEELKMAKGMLAIETRKRVAERVLERINTVETFRSKEVRLSEIIKGQARALGDFLEGKAKSYKPYLGKW